MIWTALFKLIEESNSFVISSHVSQDGDCVGSQLAFYWYLKSLGKDVTIFNYDSVPNKFKFYHNSDKISSVEPKSKFDVLVVLDASNMDRTGWIGIENVADKIIDIDHHRDNSKFGDVSIVDTNAAATCEIIYRMFADNGIDFPDYVANALFGGILSDTGGFQFNNTTKEIFAIASDLIDRGADNAMVYKKLFASHSIPGLSLRAQIWSSLHFYADNRIAVMDMHSSDFEKFGADKGDVEGMSNLAMSAEGVEVGLFFKVYENEVRCSLRSVGNVDVGKVAASMTGGGGHPFASGCTIDTGDLEDAKRQLVEIIEEKLS